MYKIRNKKFALLLTIMFVLTIMMPLATPASASSGTIAALSAPTVLDANGQTLGVIKVTVPAASIQNGDSVTMKLPSGFEFGAAPAAGAAQIAVGIADNRVVVPALIGPNPADVNGLSAVDITVAVLNVDNEIQLTAGAAQSVVQPFIFYVYLRNIDVDSGKTGDCVVTFDGPPASGFPMGNVLVGKAVSDGAVTLSVSGVDTSNSNFTFDLRIREDIQGSLALGVDSLELELPDGYTWTTVSAADALVTALWGENIQVDITRNVARDTLTIDLDGAMAAGVLIAPARATNAASAWELPLAFTVNNESKVSKGDIEVAISGETNTNISKAVVGKYGEFGASVKAGAKIPEIKAGVVNQEIADIIVSEDIAGSLLEGRSVTLELPANARWHRERVAAVGGTIPANSTTNNNLRLDGVSYMGSDYATARYNVNVIGVGVVTTSAGEVKLEKLGVIVEPGFTGDLVVKVGGTAGLTGEIVVAKVVAPLSGKVDSKATVQIGKAGQAVGTLIITENVAGALSSDQRFEILLPENIQFSKVPAVKVTEGDLKIDALTVTRATNVTTNRQLQMTIDRKSKTASTIEISGLELTLDRTIPEGDVKVGLRGPAVLDFSTLRAAASPWPNTTSQASVAIATCGTPAPGDTMMAASFVIGAKTYTLNGVVAEMDVVPYVKDGRTYLPVRYVGYALGVAPENILWDGKTATLVKGDKVVQVTVGSKAMIVNGATINLDVAPELKDGRTMLPFRWIAWAFGAAVDWDAATQTVTMKL